LGPALDWIESQGCCRRARSRIYDAPQTMKKAGRSVMDRRVKEASGRSPILVVVLIVSMSLRCYGYQETRDAVLQRRGGGTAERVRNVHGRPRDRARPLTRGTPPPDKRRRRPHCPRRALQPPARMVAVSGRRSAGRRNGSRGGANHRVCAREAAAERARRAAFKRTPGDPDPSRPQGAQPAHSGAEPNLKASRRPPDRPRRRSGDAIATLRGRVVEHHGRCSSALAVVANGREVLVASAEAALIPPLRVAERQGGFVAYRFESVSLADRDAAERVWC